MPPSKYKLKVTSALKEKAFTYYKAGMSTREIAPIVKKSHTWVAKAVNEIEGKKGK